MSNSRPASKTAVQKVRQAEDDWHANFANGSVTRQAPQRGTSKSGSSLVRRVVQAQDDPVKQHIRAWLREIDDEQLSSSLGLTPEDIAILRGTQTLADRMCNETPSAKLVEDIRVLTGGVVSTGDSYEPIPSLASPST
jgi:hypothetical protein